MIKKHLPVFLTLLTMMQSLPTYVEARVRCGSYTGHSIDLFSKTLDIDGNITGVLEENIRKDKTGRQWQLAGFDWPEHQVYLAAEFPVEGRLQGEVVGGHNYGDHHRANTHDITPHTSYLEYDKNGNFVSCYFLSFDKSNKSLFKSRVDLVKQVVDRYGKGRFTIKEVSRVSSDPSRGITLICTASYKVTIVSNEGTIELPARETFIPTPKGVFILIGLGNTSAYNHILSTLTLKK